MVHKNMLTAIGVDFVSGNGEWLRVFPSNSFATFVFMHMHMLIIFQQKLTDKDSLHLLVSLILSGSYKCLFYY